MKILSIETSCDETAVAIVEAEGGLSSPNFKVLGNALYSQIDIHKEYGGVFPMLAKREHAKNLTPLLVKALTEASEFIETQNNYTEEKWQEIKNILSREDELYDDFRKVFEKIQKPNIDLISVTSGPGLAPALWVGISFALALEKLWEISVVPVNHMEGHIVSVLIQNEDKEQVKFPALALLISGGHTELVKISDWGKYEILGQTMDDAVGEAFDKVARMLNLPYPGGPEISKLAEEADALNIPQKAKLPRPMLHSNNLNFSFSGLKTSVLYYIRDNGPLSDTDKKDLARDFENSVVDVLVSKTETAINETGAKTLIVAGGVISNKKIRQSFSELTKRYSDLSIKLPTKDLATDNALMIACASYINIILNPDLKNRTKNIIAEGNLKLK
ncbi:MAG: tRNA (adenosine(37)-N6)-threonylcarbamoyltransferase complex transferase subunit TsaD [Parcubacteria group bacterium]